MNRDYVHVDRRCLQRPWLGLQKKNRGQFSHVSSPLEVAQVYVCRRPRFIFALRNQCCTKTSITTSLIELLACHGVSRLCEVPSSCASYKFCADLPAWRCLPISAFCSLHFWTWLCSLYQINLSSITNINWVRCTQVLQGPKWLPRQAETTVATSKRGGGDLHRVRSISLWLVLALRSGEPQPWQKVCRGVENVLWELAAPGLFSVFWYYCFWSPCLL